MENIIKRLENYNPNSEKYKAQETSTLLNAKEVYKGWKRILFAFEIDIFPLPKQYPSCMADWERKLYKFITIFASIIWYLISIISTQRKSENIVTELNILKGQKEKQKII